MRKILALLTVGLVLGSAFGGTISGRLVFNCEEPPSAQGIAAVVTEAQMQALASGELDYSSLSYGLIMGSPWSFEITGEFSDDSSYYAFGFVVVNDSALEGNPMGVYPLSPFHTADGDYDGVEIPVDDTVDVTIHIHPAPDIEFTDIYALVMDISEGMFSGSGTMDTDFVAPIADTEAVIENVPSGLKQILIFKDENGNGMPDPEEPQAYCTTLDTSFVFAADGVPPSLVPEAYLSAEKIDEHNLPNTFEVSVYPSPFNSALEIKTNLPAGVYDLTISDISGKVVHSARVEGKCVYKWKPADVPSGIYYIHIAGNNISVQKQAIYMK
ncbi:MAG TPA: T9SS type A sorting domain-containing protein [candidate division Zixibacteria bacterium]|nr:T9SS type A sorting domain-containing protein [candidate division Zixibacteria bacterium]